jgi:hypothetical protein
MGGWRFPAQPERCVQTLQMYPDEGMNAALGVGAADDRQDRKQEDIALFEALAFGTTWIRDHVEPLEGRDKSVHCSNF